MPMVRVFWPVAEERSFFWSNGLLELAPAGPHAPTRPTTTRTAENTFARNSSCHLPKGSPPLYGERSGPVNLLGQSPVRSDSTGDNYELTMKRGVAQLWEGPATEIWGFDGIGLGQR